MQNINLYYNKSKTPSQNLYDFCLAVDTVKYEWVEITIEGEVKCYLDSDWQNEVGLKDITLNFQSSLTNHLMELSTIKANADHYPTILKECRELLRTANHRFSTDIANVLILTRPASLTIAPNIVEYYSLPEKQRIMVYNCFQLLVVFFRNLNDCIEEEMRDYERAQYVMKNTSYEWTNDKNDLSELALAVFESAAFKRNRKKLMPSTFAREFAAFFGVTDLHFDQDIDLIGARQRRKQGEFIDQCKDSLVKYFKEKHKK